MAHNGVSMGTVAGARHHHHVRNRVIHSQRKSRDQSCNVEVELKYTHSALASLRTTNI